MSSEFEKSSRGSPLLDMLDYYERERKAAIRVGERERFSKEEPLPEKFETGGMNLKRIRCSMHGCPDWPRSQKDLIIGESAYLYIDNGVLNSRRSCVSLEALERKEGAELWVDHLGSVEKGFDNLLCESMDNPQYLCEKCARKLRLDLFVALADGKMVAESGMAPYRATPILPEPEGWLSRLFSWGRRG